MTAGSLPGRVVDTHVHLLPGRLGEKVRAAFAEVGDALAYPPEHHLTRAQLAAEGVDEAWSLPYAHKPGVAAWLNRATAEVARQPGPVEVIPGATVHPGDDDPARIVRDAVIRDGARVLKLHCSVGDFPADHPNLDAVWRLTAEIRLPTVVHVGHDVNGATTADEVAAVERVATRHPSAPIVIAHCGHPSIGAALDAVERHEHVYVDLTPVMWTAPDVPHDRIEVLGTRVLFGSDAPNVTITAGAHLDDLRASGLEVSTLDAVCGGNATRLRAEVHDFG